MKSSTSAVLRAGRAALPAKIMSSISPPRMEVGRLSPITQRSASNKLDLPQPLGPTIAVKPGSIKSSVGSTNDLKPESLRRVNLTGNATRAAAALLFQLGIQIILQLLPVGEGGVNLAVDDEGGCAVDVVARGGVLPHLGDALLLCLIPDASVDLPGTQSRDSAHLDKAGMD